MGRNKLKIQKLESSSGRQVTYSKRRIGIMKKVKELSILCDTDALLVLFSTTGKPTLCLGENTKFEEIIKRYAMICPQERIKKKLESLEALKKTFKNTDHVIDVDQLMLQSGEKPAEDMKKQIKMFEDQIQETQIWLGPLGDLDEIENLESIDQVIAMEKTLDQLVNTAKIQKENFENMLMSHSQFPAQMQGINKGLAFNGEPGVSSQFSNINGPGSLSFLPQFTMLSQMDGGLGSNKSYLSSFELSNQLTGGVQLNGATGENNAWFYMGEPPQPYSVPQMDRTSPSNQGSSYSEETEGMNNRQTVSLEYALNGLSSSSQQITMQQNHFKMPAIGESSLSGNNAFSDNLLGQNNNDPFIFNQNFFGYMDYDSWDSVDQSEFKPSDYNDHVNMQTNRDLI